MSDCVCLGFHRTSPCHRKTSLESLICIDLKVVKESHRRIILLTNVYQFRKGEANYRAAATCGRPNNVKVDLHNEMAGKHQAPPCAPHWWAQTWLPLHRGDVLEEQPRRRGGRAIAAENVIAKSS